jgi:hypothetical protein
MTTPADWTPLRLPLRAIDVDSPYAGGVRLPARLAFLRPEAAQAIALVQGLYGRIILTDAFRSPESSLQAMTEKRGVMPPGFSGHNFGLSIDVDVDGTMKRWGCSYAELVERLAEVGFYCHRPDGRRGFEDWHFNWFGAQAAAYLAQRRAPEARTWALPLESLIVDLYADGFIVSPSEAQTILARLRMYAGEIDGIIGPRSRAAIQAFQRAWAIRDVSGALDTRTQRVMALVGAERVLG